MKPLRLECTNQHGIFELSIKDCELTISQFNSDKSRRQWMTYSLSKTDIELVLSYLHGNRIHGSFLREELS